MRFYCFSGDPVSIHAWVLNDTPEVPPGAMLRYELERASKIIQTGHAPAHIVASEPAFQATSSLPRPPSTPANR